MNLDFFISQLLNLSKEKIIGKPILFETLESDQSKRPVISCSMRHALLET